MKTAEVHRLLRAMVMRGFFFEKSVRSDKGLYSALTHSVCADVGRCQDLFTGRATVSLPFQLDDKIAAYRRGEANERARDGREVPVAPAGPGPASAAPKAPKADPVDVFAPETPSRWTKSGTRLCSTRCTGCAWTSRRRETTKWEPGAGTSRQTASCRSGCWSPFAEPASDVRRAGARD